MREQGLGSSIALQVTVSYVSEPDSISYFFFLIRINKKHLIKQLKRGSKKKKKKTQTKQEELCLGQGGKAACETCLTSPTSKTDGSPVGISMTGTTCWDAAGRRTRAHSALPT